MALSASAARRSRAWLALAGLLAVGAVLLLLMRFDSTSGAEATSDSTARSADVEPTGAVAPVATEQGHEAAAPHTNAESSARTAADAAAALPASTAQTLSDVTGSLVIDDPERGEVRDASGELRVHAAPHTAEALVTLPYEGGALDLSRLPPGSYRIESGYSLGAEGPRPVVFDEPLFELRSGAPLVLRGRHLPASRLRVLDARTGLELTRVSVLPRLEAHGGPQDSHPGPHFPSSYCTRAAPSPVRLPHAAGTRPYWVTAEGHAWSFVNVDHDAGGEREVRLEPAGRLEVQVVGFEPDCDVQLRVYARGVERAAASAVLNEGGRQAFSGLAIGIYEVRAEIGVPGETMRVLGGSRVEVHAQKTSHVSVELSNESVPAAVLVSGELRLPPAAAALVDLALDVRPADGPALRRGDIKRISRAAMSIGPRGETLRWTADHLTPGSYVFTVAPMQYAVVVEVPRGPLENVCIVVPELESVLVCARDARSRQPVADARLRWARAAPQSASARAWLESSFDAQSGCVSLAVPRGELSLIASSPTHAELRLELIVGSGDNAVALELEPRIPREILLRERDTLIPWPPSAICDVRSLGAERGEPCERAASGEMRAYFGEPGLYEITVGPLDGYRQPDPLVVAIDLASRAPIVVQLVR